MAKENKPAKKNSVSFFVKFGRFFKNLALRIVRSFREMFAELKKVTWPTRRELANYTMVVVAFMVVMGIIILGIDTASGWLVRLITRA